MFILKNITQLCLGLLLSLFIFQRPLSASNPINHCSNCIDLGFAFKLSFAINNQGQSHITVGLAFSAIWKNKKNINPFYQLGVNVYNNGLGNSLLPSRKQAEIDIINTIGVATGLGKQDNNQIENQIRPFNSMTANSVMQGIYDLSIASGTNFIINGRGRNQQVGFINLGWDQYFQFSFYNDGPPFHHMGLGDGYDRWWTGGGNIVLNIPPTWNRIPDFIASNPESLTRQHTAYYQYDRFTGDVQDAYTISNRLFLSKVPTKRIEENFYNQGQTVFGLRHAKGWGGAIMYLGSYPKLDIQDHIHDWMKFAHHFSIAEKVTLIKVDLNWQIYQGQAQFPK